MTLEGFSQPAEVEDEDTYLIRTEIDRANQAEHALIRCALLDNAMHAAAGVSSDLFQSPALRKVYDAIGSLIGDQKPADAVTVSEYLQGREPHIQWLDVIVHTMRNSMGEPERLDSYVAILKDSHKKRRTREIAEKLVIGVAKDTGAIELAIRDLMDLGQTEKRYEHDMGETLRATVAHIEEAYDKAQEGKTVGITTGLTDLDEAIGGWHPTDLIIVAGRPGVSKTGSLLNLMLNGMVPFGVFSSEQPFVQIGSRMVSIQGMVSGNRIRRGKVKAEDWQKIQAAIHCLKQRQFWINDKAAMDINELTAQARKWRYTNGVELIGVDYIQRLKATSPRMSEREKVMEVTRGLKSLAKELEIPIIALAQVNRACEGRPDKRPQMGDIAESSIVEMEADSIACLYRDEIYNPDSPDKGILEWIWHKNRHGPTGIVRTQWQGEFFKVNNFATQYYQDNY